MKIEEDKKMSNRYEKVGTWEFVGNGQVADNKTGEVFDAEMKFFADSEKINTSNREALAVEMLKQDDGSLWEMVVYDEREGVVK